MTNKEVEEYYKKIFNKIEKKPTKLKASKPHLNFCPNCAFDVRPINMPNYCPNCGVHLDSIDLY